MSADYIIKQMKRNENRDNNVDAARGCMVLIIIIMFTMIPIIGWFLNVYKLCCCDFKEPYKAEIIRVLGVVTPISTVTGFLGKDIIGK